jgi:hypothetical protein
MQVALAMEGRSTGISARRSGFLCAKAPSAFVRDRANRGLLRLATRLRFGRADRTRSKWWAIERTSSLSFARLGRSRRSSATFSHFQCSGVWQRYPRLTDVASLIERHPEDFFYAPVVPIVLQRLIAALLTRRRSER